MTKKLYILISFLSLSCLAVEDKFTFGLTHSEFISAVEGQTTTNEGPSKEELAKIAKASANPLGSLWMLWTQVDTSEVAGNRFDGRFTLTTTKFQPVMTFQFDIDEEAYNLIVRPVIQYQSVPLNKKSGKLLSLGPDQIVADASLAGLAADPFGRTEGFGDTALLTLFGPNREDGFIWGVGATQIFPTAQEDVLGQDKWQAGPALLLVKMGKDVGDWNIGALAQHWWSYAGDDDRADTSLTDVQYFMNYRATATTLIGMTPNIKYNWKAKSNDEAWTVPVGLGYSTVVKLGKLPVRLVAEIQHNVIKPKNIGARWNLRFIFIPIIPNPFK